MAFPITAAQFEGVNIHVGRTQQGRRAEHVRGFFYVTRVLASDDGFPTFGNSVCGTDFIFWGGNTIFGSWVGERGGLLMGCELIFGSVFGVKVGWPVIFYSPIFSTIMHFFGGT